MTTPDQRQVSVNLNANVDQYQASIAAAGKQTDTLTQKVANLAKSFDDLVKKTSRKLTLFGAAEVASMVAAAEAANRLDLAFTRVRSTAALTGQSVGALDSAARKLSQSIPLSTGAIGQLMGQVQDLGVRGTANIVHFTEVAEKLAAATQTAPGQLLEGIVQLTRTMGSSYQDIERYSSALVDLSKQNGVSAQGILDFSNAIEAVGSRAGYSQTQILGISAAFAKAGADGMTAAQLFNRVTTDISTAVVTGSTSLTTYANLIGTTRDGLRQMAQDDPSVVFVKVVESLKALGNQGLIVQQQLGLDSPRIQRTLAALTSGQSDIRSTIEQSNEAFTKNTALSKSANASYAQLSVSMEKFRSAMENAATFGGAGLVGIMSKIIDAGTKIINIYNDIPAPIKNTISTLTGLAAAGMAVVGVTALIALNLAKLGLLFRAVTVQPLTQAFHGLHTSMMGTREFDPKYIEGRTRAMQRMYMESYRAGDAVMRARESRAGDRGVGVARSIGMFPLRKIGAEASELWDTIKNPMPSQRDPGKNSPYGVAGAAYQLREKARSKRDDWLESDDPRVQRSAAAIFGDPQGKAAAAQANLSKGQDVLARASAARADKEKEIRALLEGQSSEMTRQMMIQKENLDNAGKQNYIARESKDISDKEVSNFITRQSKRAGLNEFTTVKANLDEEAKNGISGIRAIFDKVETMAGQISKTTAVGVTEAFNATKAGFAAAVEQIVALARLAQEQLAALRTGTFTGGGEAYHQAMDVAKKGLNLPNQAFQNVKSTAEEVKANVGQKMSYNPMATSVRPVGAPGPDVTHLATSSVARDAAAVEAEAAGHMSTFAQYSKIATTGFGLAARGAMSLGSGLLNLVGGPLGAAVIGFSVLIPILDNFAHRGRDAAAKMGDFGEEFSKALGLAYTPPQQAKSSNPADNTPFGTTEQQNSQSGSFVSAHSSDLRLLNLTRSSKERVAFAQQTIDKVIDNANKGGAATEPEQQALREMLLNANGGDVKAAQADYAKLSLGAGGSSASTRVGYNTILQGMATRAQQQGLLPTVLGGGVNSPDAQAITRELGGNLTQAYNTRPDQLAFLLNSTGLGAKNSGGLPGQNTAAGYMGPIVTSLGKTFQSQLEVFASQVNKGRPDAEKINIKTTDGITAYDVPSFLDALRLGGKESNNLAKQLSSASMSLDALKSRFDAMANDPNSLTNRMANTTLGKADAANGLGLSGADIQSQDYARNMSFGLSLIGAQGNRNNLGRMDAASLSRERAALRQSVSVIGNPGDPVSQDYTARAQALTGQINAQKNQFSTAAQAAGNYAQEIAQVTKEMGSNASAQSSFDQAQSDFQTSVTGAENTLRGYLQQVHDYHIQQQRSESEHTLQLSHMYRDRGTQLTEINYQENRRLVQQAHDFNEQIRASRYELANVFGGAAQQMEAQYTVGAATFTLGMDHQVQAMRRSKAAIDQLRREGLSNDSIRVAALDDPKQYEQAERLAAEFGQNPKMVAAFNASIKDRLQIANGLATDPNNSKFAEMKRQFDYTAKMAAESFTHSQQVSAKAFQTSLGDFQTAYETSQRYAEQDLQRIGENLYSNLNDLLKAGLTTGVSNITTFTKGITQALSTAGRAVKDYYANIYPPNAGTTGTQSTASGGPTVDTGGGGQSGYSTLVGDAGVTSAQRHGPDKTTYITPGTGAVVGNPRGTSATGDNNLATANFRPSSDFMRKHPANPNFNQSIAHAMMAAYGWGPDEYTALVNLWGRESGWNQYADNAGSGAYGIPQALPGNRMADSGADWRTNPATQIKWGLDYIKGRYKDPINAIDHENAVGWYAAGGVFESATKIGVGEAGPEAVIPLDRRGADFMANLLRAFMPTSSRLASAAAQTTSTSSTNVDITPMQKMLAVINSTLISTIHKTLKDILDAINKNGAAVVPPGSVPGSGPGGAPKPSPNVVPGVPIPSIVPPVTTYQGHPNPNGSFTVTPSLQPGQTGVPREGNGSTLGVNQTTGTTVAILPGSNGVMPSGDLNIGQINGTHDNTAIPNIVNQVANPDAATQAAYNAIAKTVVPVQHPNAQGVELDEQRAFASFPATAQAALRRGEHVTAGDGRIYALINGHATVIGFSSAVHNTAFPNSPITPAGGIINPYTPRAIGGQVLPRTPYLVGENGPELFVPSTGGNINTSMMTMSMLNTMRQNAYASPVMSTGLSTSHSESHDNSMHVHGDVHVEANDARELMRQMQQRKRLTNLAKARHG